MSRTTRKSKIFRVTANHSKESWIEFKARDTYNYCHGFFSVKKYYTDTEYNQLVEKNKIRVEAEIKKAVHYIKIWTNIETIHFQKTGVALSDDELIEKYNQSVDPSYRIYIFRRKVIPYYTVKEYMTFEDFFEKEKNTLSDQWDSWERDGTLNESSRKKLYKQRCARRRRRDSNRKLRHVLKHQCDEDFENQIWYNKRDEKNHAIL